MPNKFLKPRPFRKNGSTPNNIEECIAEMLTWDKSIDEFKNMSENAAIASSHHSVGQWIRNNWGLWSGSQLKTYFIDLGVKHPDDMSGIIILCFHRHLNNKPMNLGKQIDKIKKFYNE